MVWYQLSLVTDRPTAPELADFFSDLGAVSVTYMDAENTPLYEPLPGETRIWKRTRVIALFEQDIDPDLVKTVVFTRFNQRLLLNWRQEIIQDQAWERAWLKHFHPLKFADRLWVCPTGQERIDPDTVCLTLDPGLAFGTGTHPTTALCLEWLATQNLQNKIIIDFGCGSGILAVAALLLGAKAAHCIDIDPQALQATQSNAAKNNVLHAVHCYPPEKFPAIQADVVIANILAQPLIDLSARISGLLKTNGSLLLSGILNEQVEKVSASYLHNGLKMSQAVCQEDWCRLEGVKSL